PRPPRRAVDREAGPRRTRVAGTAAVADRGALPRSPDHRVPGQPRRGPALPGAHAADRARATPRPPGPGVDRRLTPRARAPPLRPARLDGHHELPRSRPRPPPHTNPRRSHPRPHPGPGRERVVQRKQAWYAGGWVRGSR